ncbi:MAG: ubiquinone/menaquinone biosynthesis C-methylase UbiE [Kiritimatiellia bacterium]|jgi:ubiquinone/menaquinone biosynthesis C-methylase UbiE
MKSLITLCILSLLTSSVMGQQASKEPPVFLGRKVAFTMHWKGAAWLTRTSREREEAASEMITALKIKPGMSICDMGCGNGFHTVTMSRLTGETGKVYAVDIQQEMLDFLEDRRTAAGIKDGIIIPILGGENDPKLPAASIDLLLMVDVYHEFWEPAEMLKHIRDSLKPGGRVALVEYREEDETVPIKPDHKMSKAQILKEYTASGFKLVESYDGLPWQHLMFFERKD